MAFDFPNTPSVGDLFQDSSSGAVYRWNGYAWIGGVTGIGLQTIKETRYLVAGPITHIRDPKNSSGLADIYLLGACGGMPALTSAGNICLGGGGGTGAIVIKFKYPLQASTSGVVGAGVAGANGQASSFDTVLIANGGGVAGTASAAAGATTFAGGGNPVAGGATGDENYGGTRGAVASYTNSIGITSPQVYVYLRGVVRRGTLGAVNPSPLVAQAGDAGAIFVLETLSP